MIYLDHNATSPVLPEVFDAMRPFLTEIVGNPSSPHAAGRMTRQAIDLARQHVADLIGSSPKEITFTSGGTESNNLAIFGLTQRFAPPRSIITSLIEHPAVSAPLTTLEQAGWQVLRVAVHPDGRLDLSAFRDALDHQTVLVSVMHANNETGVLQPISEIAAALSGHDARFHVDASQSIAKVPVNVDTLGVDLLTIAGHKFGAPKGVGALYIRDGLNLAPILHGADHEGGLRPGTENVASIVGLGQACYIARSALGERANRLRDLRDRLQRRLLDEIPGLHISGASANRLPNTLHVVLPDGDAPTLLSALPRLCISTASACQSRHAALSPTLRAMGHSPEDGRRALRFSLGFSTTEAEIDAAAHQLLQAWHERS